MYFETHPWACRPRVETAGIAQSGLLPSCRRLAGTVSPLVLPHVFAIVALLILTVSGGCRVMAFNSPHKLSQPIGWFGPCSSFACGTTPPTVPRNDRFLYPRGAFLSSIFLDYSCTVCVPFDCIVSRNVFHRSPRGPAPPCLRRSRQTSQPRVGSEA